MAVHGDAALGEIELVSGAYFCADPENIERLISQGEDPTRYFIGFAGWGPGQLEAEMREDSWLTAPAATEQIFAPPQDLWTLLIRQIAGSQDPVGAEHQARPGRSVAELSGSVSLLSVAVGHWQGAGLLP